MRAALAVFREGQHDDYDRVPLLGPLAMAGFFSDRRLASEFGPEAVATFERVLGLPRSAGSRAAGRSALALFLAIAPRRRALHAAGGAVA